MSRGIKYWHPKDASGGFVAKTRVTARGAAIPENFTPTALATDEAGVTLNIRGPNMSRMPLAQRQTVIDLVEAIVEELRGELELPANELRPGMVVLFLQHRETKLPMPNHNLGIFQSMNGAVITFQVISEDGTLVNCSLPNQGYLLREVPGRRGAAGLAVQLLLGGGYCPKWLDRVDNEADREAIACTRGDLTQEARLSVIASISDETRLARIVLHNNPDGSRNGPNPACKVAAAQKINNSTLLRTLLAPSTDMEANLAVLTKLIAGGLDGEDLWDCVKQVVAEDTSKQLGWRLCDILDRVIDQLVKKPEHQPLLSRAVHDLRRWLPRVDYKGEKTERCFEKCLAGITDPALALATIEQIMASGDGFDGWSSNATCILIQNLQNAEAAPQLEIIAAKPGADYHPAKWAKRALEFIDRLV